MGKSRMNAIIGEKRSEENGRKERTTKKRSQRSAEKDGGSIPE